MANFASGAQTATPMERHCDGGGSEHGIRAGTGAGGQNPRDTRSDRATRFIQTIRGNLSYTEIALLLVERVARFETKIYSGTFANRPLDDESRIFDFHRAIFGSSEKMESEMEKW